jgi:hypothetical protein
MLQILNNTRPMHVLRAYRSLHQVPAYAQNPQHLQGILMVGATGIEPVTSAVSRQRSAAELSALCWALYLDEATPGIEPG